MTKAKPKKSPSSNRDDIVFVVTGPTGVGKSTWALQNLKVPKSQPWMFEMPTLDKDLWASYRQVKAKWFPKRPWWAGAPLGWLWRIVLERRRRRLMAEAA